jgi:hypothetical protein
MLRLQPKLKDLRNFQFPMTFGMRLWKFIFSSARRVDRTQTEPNKLQWLPDLRK